MGKIMNTIIKSLSFLLVAAGITFSQDSLSNYPGIPIVIYPAKGAYNTSLAQFQQMKQMGIYGVVAPNMRRTDYENMKSAGLKIIPQQIDSTIYDYTYGTYIKNAIIKYTDAIYTQWEAEGIDEEDGDVNLQFKSTLGEKFFNENGRDGVRTKNGSSDTLIYGPGYFQYVNYKTIKEADPYITYFINFELMLKKNNPNFSSMTDTVCVLQVTGSDIEVTRDSALYEWPLFVSDFIESPADWGQWKTISRFYNLSIVEPVLIAGSRAGGIEDMEESLPEITNYFTQFKILYKGGSDLQLYVDKITVYDQRGFEIKFNTSARNKIIAQVDEYKNLTNSAVIGWYGLDEPSSIDNWEPYRIVDSLIHAQDASLYLHTGFTSGWNGKFGESNKGSHSFYTSTEFFKRAKPKNIQINLYNYHYPWKPYAGHDGYSATWQTDNINYVTNELARINQFDENLLSQHKPEPTMR